MEHNRHSIKLCGKKGRKGEVKDSDNCDVNLLIKVYIIQQWSRGALSQEVLKPRAVQGGAQAHELPVALAATPVFGLRSLSGGIK